MSTIDLQTSLTEALRKRRRTERTYVGDKGRDTPVEAILKHCGIDSKAKMQSALKQARNPFYRTDTENLTADEAIAGRNVSLQLERDFPGWQWVVKVEEGVLSFYAREISLTWGVHWSLIRGHPHESWVRKQAGEYVERHHGPTHLKDPMQFRADAKYEYGRGGLHMAFDT